MMRGMAAVCCVLAGAAQACGDPPAASVTGQRYTVAYVTSPTPVAVGQHFTMDVRVCSRDGAPPAKSVRVDATMPAHRHGMNYRPTVTQVAPGVFRAKGLLFHMSGRWEFAFDVVGANGGSERLVASVDVP
jgi:hypothetical protein